MTQRQTQELVTRDLRELRNALAQRDAKLRDLLSDSVLKAILADCRERLGAQSSHTEVMESATVRAVEVAGELLG